MPDPFIIACALNGARRTKKDHPNLPILPEEIGECAARIVKVGASIIHLHVRDDRGAHSLDPSQYDKAIDAIRRKVGDALIIQITTESCGRYDRDEQISLVKTMRPEAVSIAIREICPDLHFIGETIELFHWMAEANIFPQIILYNKQDAKLFAALQEKKAFSTPCYVLLVLGHYGMTEKTQFSFPSYFETFLSSPNTIYSLCFFGRGEYEAAKFAAKRGGHIRVGFENNLWLPDGTLASGNEELVRQAHLAGTKTGRLGATADEVRRLFNMK